MGFSREARMTRSVARGSTWQCKPDSQLPSTGVRCMLQVGPEIHTGNSGQEVRPTVVEPYTTGPSSVSQDFSSRNLTKGSCEKPRSK